MAGYTEKLQNAEIQRRRAQYLPLVQQAAAEYGIPWQMLDALVLRESDYDPTATSIAGARGLGQLMPGTAKMLGVDWNNIEDPNTNLRGAANYLAKAHRLAGGDWGQAGVGYYAGHGRIGRDSFLQRNPDVQDYANYMAAAQAAVGGGAIPVAPAAPSAQPAPPRPMTSIALGLGADFTGVDYPQIAPLQTASTAPVVPQVQAPPPRRQLSLSELFRYANYEPPAGWVA